ncbi:MAG TPA: amidase domain-containing protein [Verrucomicrobiae bacterium]|nr:amidase domain-containing protein [Verrucomicrobiae bacterium]
MEVQKNKHLILLRLRLSGMCSARKFFKLGRRSRYIVSALAILVFTVGLYQTLIGVRASYARANQSVVTPFVIQFNHAVRGVDLASLKITPAISGTWVVRRSTILGEERLEFEPTAGFRPETHYTILPFTTDGLFGLITKMPSVSFSTVRAPAVVPTGLVTLTDESTIAADTSFVVKLAEPNRNIRNLEFISTPRVVTSLTTSDDSMTYTWRPKELLPSGKTLDVEVYDSRSRQAIVQKQLVVAAAPQIASFNEPTGFSQGDIARITFSKPLDTTTAKVQFDVAGSGSWTSSTVYTFAPTTVQPGQTYRYTVAAGLRSTDGGVTGQSLTGSFSTFGAVGVSSVSPTGSGLNQASQTVSFTFDHAVDHQSAASHFSISAGTVTNESWNGNTFLATVTNLGYGQTITATMASGVANVGFGLPSSQTTQFTFHTALETGVAAQLAYAIAHWDDTDNATYGNLDSVGGDCANFVSQTLIARGWKMDSQWYDYGPNDWSAAWGYVPSLDDYLSSNSSKFGLQYLTASQRSQYAVGDIVVFSWEGTPNANTQQDHVEMISQITNQNGQISVKLASHNNYGLYRDLDEQITVEHPGATFHVWHLTQDTN